MPTDELSLWRHLLATAQLPNLLVISTSRCNSDEQPRDWLSQQSEQILVPPLDEKGVCQVINVCLHDAVEHAETLASYIFAETKGSSLYGRTLLATLVKEKVIYFDFGMLKWRFNSQELSRHLSTSGLDAYIERLIRELPAKVRNLLEVSYHSALCTAEFARSDSLIPSRHWISGRIHRSISPTARGRRQSLNQQGGRYCQPGHAAWRFGQICA